MRLTTVWAVLLLAVGTTCHLYAGASGIGSFENDDAMDWVENELKPSGLKAVQRAIHDVISTKGYLQAPTCNVAIAACEVLAAAQSRPSADLPPEVAALATKLPSKPAESLRNDARDALSRILAKSELRSLWAESKDYEQWRNAVTALKERL
jgi:hypothetical protein